MPVGLCDSKLENVQNFMAGYVDDGRLPGYACLVSHRGAEALFLTCGDMDVERGKPILRDTIFRIYSMTKPITSVALMMLYEKGHFQLDDPVAKYIPSWKDLKVFASGDEHDYQVADPARAMTIKDLLTHTSGLVYGFQRAHPVDAMYRARGQGELRTQGTLDDMIEMLAEVPLKFSPGTRWNYGVSTDVLGYLVQRFADQPLDEYIAERITGPLGMVDSDFSVRQGQAERFAACYHRPPGSDTCKLQDDPQTSPYLSRPTFLSGGGGMVSTIDDYHRFTQMLLGKGALDGARLLGRKTVEYMTMNHMPDNQDLKGMGQPVFSETPYEGIGFGLGFSVVIDPAAANVLDSVGDYAWGGAASTYFWNDPSEHLTVLFMTQLIPSSSYPIRRQLKALVYQALVD